MKRNTPLILGLILLAGCQSQLLLMPTPEVLKDPRFDVFAANPEPMTSNTIATLYATTRVPEAPPGSPFFTATPDDEIHIGYTVNRIGDENLNLFELIDQSTTGERAEKFAWSVLEAPILGSAPRPGDSRPSTAPPAGLNDSLHQLNDYINDNPIKELTIYVHGASNTFNWSVSQGAQFQYFTGDNAMVLSFSWPSPGSIFGYGRDKRRSDESAADLAYLIELLARHSDATRINLLAYSAGGRVVGRALAQLGSRHEDRETLRLGQVYLTQSDQALEEFVHGLPVFIHLLEGLTITAAEGDPVLTMASMTDRKIRLGAVGQNSPKLDIDEELRGRVIDILNSDTVVLVDLANVPATGYRFSHGAWYDSSWVSTDVMVTLLGGLSATERGLTFDMVDGVQVWSFPPDYVERLKTNLLNRQADSQLKLQSP